MIQRLKVYLFVTIAISLAPVACTQVDPLDPELGKLPAPLISSKTTMTTAWQVPNNPLEDPTLGDSEMADQIRWGFELFRDTPGKAPHLTGGNMSCNNCHINAGQRELALPLVGVAAMFPEYNNRAGRDFTLEDRIVGCFFRSENATGKMDSEGNPSIDDPALPTPETPEVVALAAYLRWLSRAYEPGTAAPWRKKNVIPKENLLPIDKLDPKHGEALFLEWCWNCHGKDGQGVQIGDKKPGPLWGPNSWNDGAGAARIYTLAGMIRHMMPYLEPGKFSDEDAQHLSAFINSHERPSYPFKELDYQTASQPIDALYYPPPQ